MYVDGVDIGDPDDAALRDRREISADGIFIVVVTVSSDDGAIVADPEVILRGVPFLDNTNSLLEDLKDLVEDKLEDAVKKGAKGSAREPELVQEDLHDAVGKFVWQRLKRRPMVLPVVIEV
jgi:ribonuclease J